MHLTIVEINRNSFRIPQQVNINHRCDKIQDCQDGTDEEGCTCRDYLAGNQTALICNGHVDCADKTDEENCRKRSNSLV